MAVAAATLATAAVAVPLVVHGIAGADAAGTAPAAAVPGVATGPLAVLPADAFTTAVTDGNGVTGLYAFLAARQNHLVHLQFTVAKPKVSAPGAKTTVLAVPSGCTATSTTPICMDNLNPAGLRIAVTGGGISARPGSGGYSVTGDARVGAATRDASGYYTVSLTGEPAAALSPEDDKD